MNSTFTGIIYNYVQLELTVKVRCIGVAKNMDENCVCLPGFTGLLCENFNNCTGIECKNGNCVDGSCKCNPGFTGAVCESGKHHNDWILNATRIYTGIIIVRALL